MRRRRRALAPPRNLQWRTVAKGERIDLGKLTEDVVPVIVHTVPKLSRYRYALLAVARLGMRAIRWYNRRRFGPCDKTTYGLHRPCILWLRHRGGCMTAGLYSRSTWRH